MRDPSILLFGFGALLHPSKMFDRQPKWTACVAPEHALTFRHRMGFATLEPLGKQRPTGIDEHRSPACAHGVVYWLTPDEVEELSRRERGYTLQTIPVRPLDCSSDEDLHQALAFVSSRWNLLNRPVAPTRRYANLIVDGAELRGLPEEYIRWLRVEQAGSLDTSSSAKGVSSKPDMNYYATRGAFVSWGLAAVFAASWVGVPLAELMSRASTAEPPLPH